MNEKVTVTGDAIFIINDIELEIPPTQISIQKEDLYWSWKTLRTKISTKIPSSHGVLHVQLNIIFTPDQLITLHRLVTEFRNSPYCYVKNKYLRNNICESWGVAQNMAFTMVGLDVSSLSDAPGSFQVQLALRWFNYFPYTPNFIFKKDFLTKPLVSSKDGYTLRFTIPTVTGKFLKFSQKPIIQKAFSVENYVESFSAITETLTGKSEGSITLEDMLKTHSGQVFDLSPLPSLMENTTWANPYNSNIYKRYINTLQQKYLYENFDIDLYQYFDQDFIKQKYTDNIYNYFTIGVRDEGKEEEVQKESKQNLKVYGLHEPELPDEIKAMIILKMLSSMHDFNIFYDNYKAIYKSPILTDIDIEIKKLAGNVLTQKYQKDLVALSAISSTSSSGVFIASDSTEEYRDYLERINAPKTNDLLPEGQQATATKGITVPTSGTTSKEEEYRYFHPLCGTQVDAVVDLKISCGFGWRWRHWDKVPTAQFHDGIDLVAWVGGSREKSENLYKIYAPLDGVIQRITVQAKGYGRRINIQHADGLITVYGHLGNEDKGKKVYMDPSTGVLREPKKGDIVKRGQAFATIGNTGGSTGSHIHFEVRLEGKTVDPYPYLIITHGGVAATSAAVATGGGAEATTYDVNAYTMSDDGFTALINKWDYLFLQRIGIEANQLYYPKETSEGFVLTNVERLAMGFEYIPSLEPIVDSKLPINSSFDVCDELRRYPLEEDFDTDILTSGNKSFLEEHIKDLTLTTERDPIIMKQIRDLIKYSYELKWEKSFESFEEIKNSKKFSDVFPTLLSNAGLTSPNINKLFSEWTSTENLATSLYFKRTDVKTPGHSGGINGMLTAKNIVVSNELLDNEIGGYGLDVGIVYDYVKSEFDSNDVLQNISERYVKPHALFGVDNTTFLTGSLLREFQIGFTYSDGKTNYGPGVTKFNQIFEMRSFWKGYETDPRLTLVYNESFGVNPPERIETLLIGPGFKVDRTVANKVKVPINEIRLILKEHANQMYQVGINWGTNVVYLDGLPQAILKQTELEETHFKASLLNVFHPYTKKYAWNYWYNPLNKSILPGQLAAGKFLSDTLGRDIVKFQLKPIELQINQSLKNKISQSQFDTIVSLSWDLGFTNNIVQNVIVALNENKPPETITGLIKRRSAYKNVLGLETIHKYPGTTAEVEDADEDTVSNTFGSNSPEQYYNYKQIEFENSIYDDHTFTTTEIYEPNSTISKKDNHFVSLDNLSQIKFRQNYVYNTLLSNLVKTDSMSFDLYNYDNDWEDQSVFALNVPIRYESNKEYQIYNKEKKFLFKNNGDFKFTDQRTLSIEETLIDIGAVNRYGLNAANQYADLTPHYVIPKHIDSLSKIWPSIDTKEKDWLTTRECDYHKKLKGLEHVVINDNSNLIKNFFENDMKDYSFGYYPDVTDPSSPIIKSGWKSYKDFEEQNLYSAILSEFSLHRSIANDNYVDSETYSSPRVAFYNGNKIYKYYTPLIGLVDHKFLRRKWNYWHTVMGNLSLEPQGISIPTYSEFLKFVFGTTRFNQVNDRMTMGKASGQWPLWVDFDHDTTYDNLGAFDDHIKFYLVGEDEYEDFLNNTSLFDTDTLNESDPSGTGNMSGISKAEWDGYDEHHWIRNILEQKYGSQNVFGMSGDEFYANLLNFVWPELGAIIGTSSVAVATWLGSNNLLHEFPDTFIENTIFGMEMRGYLYVKIEADLNNESELKEFFKVSPDNYGLVWQSGTCQIIDSPVYQKHENNYDIIWYPIKRSFLKKDLDESEIVEGNSGDVERLYTEEAQSDNYLNQIVGEPRKEDDEIVWWFERHFNSILGQDLNSYYGDLADGGGSTFVNNFSNPFSDAMKGLFSNNEALFNDLFNQTLLQTHSFSTGRVYGDYWAGVTNPVATKISEITFVILSKLIEESSYWFRDSTDYQYTFEHMTGWADKESRTYQLRNQNSFLRNFVSAFGSGSEGDIKYKGLSKVISVIKKSLFNNFSIPYTINDGSSTTSVPFDPLTLNYIIEDVYDSEKESLDIEYLDLDPVFKLIQENNTNSVVNNMIGIDLYSDAIKSDELFIEDKLNNDTLIDYLDTATGHGSSSIVFTMDSDLIANDNLDYKISEDQTQGMLDLEIKAIETLCKLLIYNNKSHINIFDTDNLDYFNTIIETTVNEDGDEGILKIAQTHAHFARERDDDLLFERLIGIANSYTRPGRDSLFDPRVDPTEIDKFLKIILYCLQFLGLANLTKHSSGKYFHATKAIDSKKLSYKINFIRNCLIYQNALKKNYISTEEDKLLFAFTLKGEVSSYQFYQALFLDTGLSQVEQTLFNQHVLMNTSYKAIKDVYKGQIKVESISNEYFNWFNEISPVSADYFKELTDERSINILNSRFAFHKGEQRYFTFTNMNPIAKEIEFNNRISTVEPGTSQYIGSVFLPFGNIRALLNDALGEEELRESVGSENINQELLDSKNNLEEIKLRIDSSIDSYLFDMPLELTSTDIVQIEEEIPSFGTVEFLYPEEVRTSIADPLDIDYSFFNTLIARVSVGEDDELAVSYNVSSSLRDVYRQISFALPSNTYTIYLNPIIDAVNEYQDELANYLTLISAVKFYDLLGSRSSEDWKATLIGDTNEAIYFNQNSATALLATDRIGYSYQFKKYLGHSFTNGLMDVYTDWSNAYGAIALRNFRYNTQEEAAQQEPPIYMSEAEIDIVVANTLGEKVITVDTQFETSDMVFTIGTEEYNITSDTVWMLIESYLQYLHSNRFFEVATIHVETIVDYINTGKHPLEDTISLFKKTDDEEVDVFIDRFLSNALRNIFFEINLDVVTDALDLEKTVDVLKGSGYYKTFYEFLEEAVIPTGPNDSLLLDPENILFTSADGENFDAFPLTADLINVDEFIEMSDAVDTFLDVILQRVDEAAKSNLNMLLRQYSKFNADLYNFADDNFASKQGFLEKNTTKPKGYMRLLQVYEQYVYDIPLSGEFGHSTFPGDGSNYFYQLIQYYDSMLLSSDASNGRADDEVRWYLLDTATVEEDDIVVEAAGDTIDIELETSGIELTKEQKEALQAYELALIAEVAKGWEPYQDVNGLSNVLKQTVKLSYSNPNYTNSIDFDFMKKYFQDVHSKSIPFDYKQFIMKGVAAIGASDISSQERLMENLTYWKEHILTRVSGSISHVVSNIPIVGQAYPTSQHLGSIEPSFKIEMVCLPDRIMSDGLNESTKKLVKCLSTLQQNSKSFRQVPDCYAFALDSFITRLFGSFTVLDYAVSSENIFKSKLLKRLCCTKQFAQTVPGSPGLSNLMLNLEETNPFKVEKILPEKKGSSTNTSNIKDALHALYNLKLDDDARVYLLLKKFADQKNGIEAFKYLEPLVTAEQLKIISSFAIVSEADSTGELTESKTIEFEFPRSDSIIYYTPDSHSSEYDTMTNLVDATAAVEQEREDFFTNNPMFLNIEDDTDIDTGLSSYTIDNNWFADAGFSLTQTGLYPFPVYVSYEGYIEGEEPPEDALYALPIYGNEMLLTWNNENTYIRSPYGLADTKRLLEGADFTESTRIFVQKNVSGYTISNEEADFWQSALAGAPMELRQGINRNKDGSLFISENAMRSFINDHFEYYGNEPIVQSVAPGTDSEDVSAEHVGYNTTNFYAANPGFNTLVEGTSESTIIMLQMYYDLLIATFKKARFTLAESEAGGIERELIKTTLYDFGKKPEEKGLVDPFMWRNYIYYIYAKFFNSLASSSGGGIHYGVRSTSSFVENMNYVLGYDTIDLKAYFSSIVFEGLYDSDTGVTEGEKEFVAGYMPSSATGYNVHFNDPEDPSKGVSRSSSFNLNHYWAYLYDDDLGSIINRARRDTSSFSAELFQSLGNDKSVLAGFANVVSVDVGTETLGALLEALTMNSDFEKLNRLYDYKSARTHIVGDYTEFATSEKGYHSNLTTYVSSLAPLFDEKSEYKFKSSLGNYFQSFDALAEKLFSPRAVLDRNLYWVADWGGRSTIGREGWGVGYAPGESTTGTISSGIGAAAGGAVDNTLGIMGVGGAISIADSVAVHGFKKQGLKILGGGGAAVTGFGAKALGVVKQAGLPAFAVVGTTLGAVGEGIPMLASAVTGGSGESFWVTDKLSTLDDLRSSGTFGNAVDNLVLGYEMTNLYNKDNVFEGSRGKGDIRVRPDILKNINLSDYTLKEFEESKLNELANTLTELGKVILDSSEVSAALNLVGKSATSDFKLLENVGLECYPDLDLPLHPYYNHSNSYATSPDFYFWNLYEDGDAKFKNEHLKLIKEQADLAISHSYNHLRRMQKSGIISQTNRNLYVKPTEIVNIEPATEEGSTSFGWKLTHHPDGSSKVDDGSDVDWNENAGAFVGFNTTGAATSAYLENTSIVKVHNNRVQNYIKLQTKIAKETDSDKKESLENQLELLEKLDRDSSSIFSPITLLDNFDGIQPGIYSSNTFKMYQEYAQKIQGIEKMFGSRAGYTGQYISEEHTTDKTKEIAKEAMDNGIHLLDEFNHSFDYNSLSALCRDSASDILQQKWSMKRAYPTFKLFFIEEDEMENRFINLDDFYTFNGVKQFIVNRDRDIAADTAVITLQNIAGTLDGTKRGSVVDLDYFEERLTKDMAKTGIEVKSNNNETVSTKDQPFSSIVLRPGSNVQLRCGYSNDPNMLEVLISGRVTDVAWSQIGDLCEITVQSFGAELVQHIKGLNAGDKTALHRTYPATHHLLGCMMLSPELQHFGRWEFGQSYQHGEAKDHKLDLYKYKDSHTFFGLFDMSMSRKVASTITDNLFGLGLFVTGIVALRFGMANPGTFSSAKSFITAGTAKILSTSAKSTSIVDSSLLIADDALRITSGASRAVSTGKVTFSIDGLKNAFKAILSPILPRQLLNGNANTIVKGVARTRDLIASGADKIIAAGQAPTANILSKAGAAPIRLARWFTAGGTEAVKYSPEVIKTVKNLIQTFNIGGKALVRARGGAGLVAKAADDWAIGWLNNVDELIKGLNAGKKLVSPLKKSRDALKLAMDAAKIPHGTPGAGTWEQVLRAQADVLQSINRVDRLARLNAVTGNNLYKMVAEETFLGQGRALGASLFHGYFNTLMSISTGGLVYSFGALGVDGISSVYKALIVDQDYRKQYMRLKANLILEPQDDNLYPPNPLTYMRLEELKDDTIGSWISDFVSLDTVGVLPLIGDFAKYAASHMERWKTKPKFITKRVTVEQAEYTINNTTVWDIFKEMTLRHPGWIYGAVPYGNKLRYTMFFGVPSQRYWSKPASNTFISRMNRLREFIGIESPNKEVLKKQWTYFYGEESYDLTRTELIGEYTFETWEDDGSSSTPITTTYYDDFRTPESEVNTEPVEDTIIVAEMALRLKSRVMKEYLLGLENRFIPFRRYHNIDSEKDIISNNIMGSNKNVINAVSVNFIDKENETIKTLPMKASSTIKDEEINMANVSAYTNNIKGYSMALRYGMGELIYGMKEMYRGELLVLGNARLKPWDVCYLFDSYNDMFGPFEIKAVTHTFSHETGFITEIIPNAIVIGNEVSSQPIIEGLKLFVAAVKDKERNFHKIDGSAPGTYANFPDKINIGSWLTAEYDDDLKEKYAERIENFDFDKIWEGVDEETKKAFESMSENEIYKALLGHGKFTVKAIETGVNFIGAATDAEVIAATTLGGMGGIGLVKKAGWGGSTRKGKAAVITGLAGLLGIGTHYYTDDANVDTFTFSNDLFNSNENWLAAAPLLFTKFMEEEAVCVLPLIKEGQPIVSGMSLRDPMSMWQSTFGVITNRLNDSIRGVKDYEEQSKRYGMAYWSRMRQLNKGLIKDRHAREIVRGLLNEDGLDENAIELSISDTFKNWVSTTAGTVPAGED